MSFVLSRHIYFPLAEVLKRTPVTRRLRELEESQWFSEERLRLIAAERLAGAIEAARRDAPYYRDRLGGLPAATPGNAFEVLEEIPVLTKARAAGNLDDLRSRGRSGGAARCRSEGIAGQAALEFPATRDFLARTEAAQWRGRGWWGMRRGDKMLALWGKPVTCPRSAGRIARREKMRNWLRISGIEPGHDLAARVEEIARFGPEYIYGHGASIYGLALHYSEQALPPPPRLKAIFCAGDGLLGFQRRLVEEALRAPVAREYGVGETGAFAFECREGGIHIASENVHVEVLRNGRPVEEGDAGEVTVTVLHNRAMPLIRYNLGAWARRIGGRCACGRMHHRIEPMGSKESDLVRTSEGRAASGHLFDSILMELIDLGYRGIRQFLAIQKELDRFVVQIISGPKLSPECLGLFEGRMREKLGGAIEVQFEVVPEIPRDPGGRMVTFRSEIPMPAALGAAGMAREALRRTTAKTPGV
jgi:phenylacetate-CoA ligase